jgi:hypothetical protein
MAQVMALASSDAWLKQGGNVLLWQTRRWKVARSGRALLAPQKVAENATPKAAIMATMRASSLHLPC